MSTSPSGSGRRPRAKPWARGGGATTEEERSPSLDSDGERNPPDRDRETEEERGTPEDPEEELTIVVDGEGALPQEGAPPRELAKPAATYWSTRERAGGVMADGRLDKPRRVRWWAKI